jgi:hypothetical protein
VKRVALDWVALDWMALDWMALAGPDKEETT